MQSKYIGVYPIRKIGKNELGIHMPPDITGDYRIDMQDDGVIKLTPQGVRRD